MGGGEPTKCFAASASPSLRLLQLLQTKEAPQDESSEIVPRALVRLPDLPALGLFASGTSPGIGGKTPSSLSGIQLPISDISSRYSFACANGICEYNCKSTIRQSRRSN
jgi:hypothetical protein